MEQKIKIYSALTKARAEFKPVIFDKTNPHFKSRFASLNAINDATVAALSKYGLMAIQPWIHLENGDIILETIIIHESGAEIKSSCLIKSGKTDQQFGASCTYIRRYQLSSILGVVGEEEDDGEEDRKFNEKRPANVSSQGEYLPSNAQSDGITEKQKNLLGYKLKTFPAARDWIIKEFSVSDPTDVTKDDFQKIMKMFEKKEAEAKETT